jgi:hypothetical protein
MFVAVAAFAENFEIDLGRVRALRCGKNVIIRARWCTPPRTFFELANGVR